MLESHKVRHAGTHVRPDVGRVVIDEFDLQGDSAWILGNMRALCAWFMLAVMYTLPGLERASA
jgi:hypothetical protein